MGRGKATVTEVFLPALTAPEFNMKLRDRESTSDSLNPLLKACARTEVSGGGVFTVYSQLGVKKRHHDGYLKPLFMDLEVYNRRQEKGRSLTHQIKGLAIAGAARILKIRTRRNRPVLSMYPRKLTKPNVSTWQAIVEVLRNAFIKAILPGFDRTAQGTAAQPDNYQDTR